MGLNPTSFSFSMGKEMFRFVLLPCLDLGLTVPMYIRTYGIRQKECNMCAAAALISTAYFVPCLSLCVCRTLTLSLKVRCFVKRRNPWIAAHFTNINLSHIFELIEQVRNCKITKINTRKIHYFTFHRIAAHLPKSAAIRFLHKSRGNHKSMFRFLSKSGAQMFN